MRWVWFALLFCLAVPLWADIFDGAEWLRDPRMKGLPVRDYYGREPKKQPESAGPWNQHTLFRKEIRLKAVPESAAIYITGDDYYKFSINGEPVVQGPESGYPFAHPYYYLDVTPYLREGVNVLASHSYYQGLVNRVWNSGDNRNGFICKLVVEYAGKSETFSTDKSWRCFPLEAFQGMDTAGYNTQFLENIDLRLMPRGWEMPGYREKDWQKPFIERQDHVFTRQLTPPLELRRMDPAKTSPVSGGLLYDFGTELVGELRVKVRGTAGQQITVRHAEELDAQGRARYALRANAVYEETCTLSGEEDLVEFYDYKGFRYVEVLGLSHAPEVWVEARHHPWPANAATFESSDKKLSAIWELCRNSVQWGAQGGFLDCPTREKGQYFGDTAIAARAHLWLTGDASLTRKALSDFAYSAQIQPGLMSIAPGNIMQEIADYSLQYPMLLREYYRFTGDRGFADLMATAVLPGLFQHFRPYENAEGLLENYREKQILIDWPANLRDDYDWKANSSGINTVLNVFYFGALQAAADLMRDLGRESLLYERHAQHVAEGIEKRLLNADNGLFVDALGSRHSSLHANALPLAFGLGLEQKDKILALIRQKRLACGVYFAPYVIQACFRGGDTPLGYDLLTSDDQNSWSQMLRNDATTCTEIWMPEQKENMSWCHAWGSSPVYLIAEEVFGVTPAAAGWKKIRFAPPAGMRGLPDMTLAVPLPQGTLQLSYNAAKGFAITPPPGVEVLRAAPSQGASSMKSAGALTDTQRGLLEKYGWKNRVGEGRGVWIDVATQNMYIIENMQPVWQARVGTATAGTGSTAGSQKTPLGWHKVDQKFGANAPWGQVFRSRGATKEIWKPGMDVVEDMVLTRILWLDGLEPGKNKGRNEQGVSVDSKSRCIYIHGTNGENVIGTPSSHGCIRLLNDAVIEAFQLIPEETLVLITP